MRDYEEACMNNVGAFHAPPVEYKTGRIDHDNTNDMG